MTVTLIDHETVAQTDARIATRSFWLLGNRFTVLANERDTGGRYDLIEGRKPAGNQTPPHRHTRYAEHIFVVDGELTVWKGSQRVTLRAGDAATIPAGTAHAVAVTGDRPALSLIVTAPSGFARFVQAAGVPATDGPAPESTPADLQRITRMAAEGGDEILGPPGVLPVESDRRK